MQELSLIPIGELLDELRRRASISGTYCYVFAYSKRVGPKRDEVVKDYGVYGEYNLSSLQGIISDINVEVENIEKASVALDDDEDYDEA